MEELNQYRQIIDNIDGELADLFIKRLEVVKKIGEYKRLHKLPVYNASREQTVLGNVTAHTDDQLIQSFVKNFFCYMMQISKEYQQLILGNIE